MQIDVARVWLSFKKKLGLLTKVETMFKLVGAVGQEEWRLGRWNTLNRVQTIVHVAFDRYYGCGSYKMHGITESCKRLFVKKTYNVLRRRL